MPVALAEAQVSLSFVTVTPCRVVDTRLTTGTFGGPSMPAATTRSFPIPSGSCNIPSNAAAYSINVTVAPPNSPVYVLELWPAGQSQPLVSTLNAFAGVPLANAAIVPAGTNGAIDIWVSNNTDVVIDINGYFIPASNSATESTAIGTGASNAGVQNTGVGFDALQVNSAGIGNTATGSLALSGNTSGSNNVGIGASALILNATGSANTAVGGQSLLNNLIGSDNTAIGFDALSQNTVGVDNTAIGVGALSSNNTGSSNIAIGYQAGSQIVSGSYNIDIGNQGQSADSNAIRIGDPANQNSTFIAGITGVNIASGSTVLVNSNGQLGTIQSSLRYKDDVQNMGEASDALMQLHPVTFRYKQPLQDGSKPLQYGLIGEEVEKIYPELVVYDSTGQVQSVQYHELPALLLNELQKQHSIIQRQQTRIAEDEELIRAFDRRIATLEKRAQ